MPRLTAADFPREVLALFDQYVHGSISRRGFLDGASRHAVGGMTAAGLLAALSPDFAGAQQVSPTDARLSATFVDFDSPKGYGKARGYLVKPKDAAAILDKYGNIDKSPLNYDVTTDNQVIDVKLD